MNYSSTIVFIAAVALLYTCEKDLPDEPEFLFDCYKKTIAYTESGEFEHQFNTYYLNGLLARRDCSPSYIWDLKYDDRGNLIRSASDEGWFNLNSYDDFDRLILSKSFVKDTLYSITESEYSDTLLIKEFYYNHIGELSNTTDYFYDAENRLDSVISNTQNIYHQYLHNQYIITREDKKGIKTSEEIKTTEGGFVTRYEEYVYSDGELIRSLMHSTEYNENGQLVISILEQFQEGMNQFPNYPDYVETRYLYNTTGDIIKTEDYDAESLRFKFVEYQYDSGELVKKQSFDSDGIKNGYTIVEDTCN